MQSPSESPDSATRRRAVWLGLWGVLAVLHVTQGIWLSRGAAYPGDLGDGRFNQLVLEHGYQSLRGVYDWASPGQFFPARNTLGYSDTHAGTLPIYAALRGAGVSIERAWQAWFVLIAALNVIATLRLFSALGIPAALRGPLAFAASSSVTMVWLAGTHMQMLPMFPALLAWDQAVRWSADRQSWRLLAIAGWICWQFAAGPYLGFFSVVITAVVAMARLAAGRWLPSPTRDAGVTPGRTWAWVYAIAVGVFGAGLGTAAANIYLHAVQSGAGRALGEVTDLTPSFAAWFTAPPAHVLYPAGWPGRAANPVELAWLAGFLPWLLLPLALAVGWRQRHTVRGAWMLALAGGALAVTLFFTQWGTGHRGLWVSLAAHLEPLRAFRSSGRVAGLLQVVQIAAAGLVCTAWQARAALGRWRLAPLILAVLCAVEGLGRHQPVTRLATAEGRAEALIAAWRAAGDRPVLAFAPGYTNQPDAWVQLDAWSAAVRRGRVTFNGYSGSLPGTHQAFLWNSTPENARRLRMQAGLDENQVSIVEQLSPAAEAAFAFTRQPHRPVVNLTGFDLQPVAWRLFAPLETFVIDGVTMYQFTPTAEVRFHLPDTATRAEVLVGLRPDAYTGGGQSDGVGVTWLVQAPGRPEKAVFSELLNPRDRPEHRGILRREFTLPAGADRILILRTDPGPAGSMLWDFPLFGQLRTR